jgi:hypothetical protein
VISILKPGKDAANPPIPTCPLVYKTRMARCLIRSCSPGFYMK